MDGPETQAKLETRHKTKTNKRIRVRFMVLNATFNNILVISWQPVLLMEETGVPGEPPTCKSLTNFTT